MRDRIIVHLAPYSKYADEYECPQAISQAGISIAIGKSRAHTTLELNRMKEAGLVAERLAHVKGTRSKRKTYTLANQALVTERQIAVHVEGLKVELSGSGEPGAYSGRQAADVLMKELTVSRAMAFDLILSSGGRIDLEEHRARQVSRTEPVEAEPDIVDRSATIPEDARTFDALLLQANTLSKKGRHDEALAVLGKATSTELSGSELSRAQYARASTFRKQGNYPAALEEVNKALAAAEETNNPLQVGRCQMEKAIILLGKGNHTQPLELLDSAEMIFRRENSQVDLMRCGINQGIVLSAKGNKDEAVDVLDMSLDLAEKTGLDRLRAYAMANLTDLLNELEDYQRSAEMARTAADIFRVLDEPLMLAASLYNLGTAQIRLGEKDEGMSNKDKAITIIEKNGLLSSRTSWLEEYTALLEEMGETEKAKAIRRKI